MLKLLSNLLSIIFFTLIITSSVQAQMSVVWEQQTNAYSSYNARAEKIAYDSEENLIIAGYSWYGIYNSNQTVFVMKMTPEGEIIWLQRFMGAGVGQYDNGTVNGLFIDSEDNVLLFAKYFSQKAIKYDKDGNLISADDYTFDLPFTINVYNNSYLFDQVHKDASGYFHIGGIITDYGTTYSYYAQFNPQLELWASNVQSIFSTTFDFGSSVLTYYDYFKIFVLGRCNQGGYPSTASGICLSSMTTSGVVEWSTPNWYSDHSRWPVKMLRANDGTMYLAISWENSSGNERGSYLQKLGPDGLLLWEVPAEHMYINDIEFDNGGNIWVSGNASSSYPGGNATLAAKYSSAGETLVFNIIEEHYWSGQLIVNKYNDIYLVDINSDGVFVVKYNWNGDKLDEVKISSNSNSSATILTIDEHNDLIVCFDFNENVYIKKITDGATGVDEDAQEKTFSLSQNYPNPFNPSTQINYSIPESGNVRLIIYDLLGEEVKTIIDQFQNAGSYSIEFNAEELSSGVYFYRLSAGQFSETKKLLLLR